MRALRDGMQRALDNLAEAADDRGRLPGQSITT